MKSLVIPDRKIQIQKIDLKGNIQLSIKREDQIHPEISGNKYWKLFYNLNDYLSSTPAQPLIITFGGAFSNHIAATSYAAKLAGIRSIGIIRGEELAQNYGNNPTLNFAKSNGMDFSFVSREEYRNKAKLKEHFINLYPNALIVEEGGTNANAVRGIQHMLKDDCKDFQYLCSAVGTGGTLAGLSKYCEDYQKVIGFKAVQDDSLTNRIFELSGKNNFTLIEATERYGKMSLELVSFINWFYDEYQIPLDPVYTGKMMFKIFKMIDAGYFPADSKILTFHTGGLQGIEGANEFLMKKALPLIKCTAI